MKTSKIKPTWLAWGILTLAIGVILLMPVPFASAAPAERTVRVEASSFEFNPATVRVDPGDHVTLEIVATDVTHGIYVDGYNLQAVAEPGQTARLSFTADKSGSFRLRCPVTCGSLHPFMIGKLHVGYNWLLVKTIVIGIVLVMAVLWSFYR